MGLMNMKDIEDLTENEYKERKNGAWLGAILILLIEVLFAVILFGAFLLLGVK